MGSLCDLSCLHKLHPVTYDPILYDLSLSTEESVMRSVVRKDLQSSVFSENVAIQRLRTIVIVCRS